jgi:murein DD-endopeptidase MepM/ murein hydrolase activator NlpD
MIRKTKRALAMTAVTLAFASALGSVLPSAQAEVSATGPVESAQPQVLDAVRDLPAAAIVRDGWSITDPPKPTPQPRSVVFRLVGDVPPTSSAELVWPVARGTAVVSAYGPRSCRGCSSFHGGADFAAPGGSPIAVIANGVVIETDQPGYGSLGIHATVQHLIDGQIVTSVYAHMIPGSLTVGVGDRVTTGQILGQVGCSGSCTGTHLHFEIHPNGAGAVDPIPWLTERTG